MTEITDPSRPIAVLSGTSPYARLMVDIYRRQFGTDRVVVIEERRKTMRLILTFLSRRVRSRGIVSAVDALVMRMVQFFLPMPAVSAEPAPNHVVASVNDPAVASLLSEIRPRAVILSVCSLLSGSQIERIGAPIFNVHNGLTPRYRGSGNIFAMAEDNFSRIGVTVHSVDAGIDTGQRLDLATFDPIAESIPFERVDEIAFARGAELLIRLLNEGTRPLPAELVHLNDGFYPYPGLRDWLRARCNFRRHRRDASGPAIEAAWKESFADRASSSPAPLHERMHWSDGSSLTWRDDAAVAALEGLPAQSRILDLGCGDARLARRLPQFDYIGCDACLPFLQEANDVRRTVADARSLPFADGSIDAVLAIGLFQHLSESQLVADEIRRVLKPGGRVVLNTLRQFSKFELVMIWLLSLHDPARRRLVQAIWQRRFGVHASPDAAVGRRYKPSEIASLFGIRSSDLRLTYHGAGNHPLMAREITVGFEPPPPRRNPGRRK